MTLTGIACAASAQSTDDLTLGLQQNSSYHGGDIDLVNLGTGNLMIKIPLVSYPQRGGSLKLEYDLIYNGGVIADRYWCPPPPAGQGTAAPPPDPSFCVQSWHAPPFPQPRRGAWRLVDMQNVTTGVLVHSETPTYQQYSSQEYTYAFASFQTADGAVHVGEPAPGGVTQRSVDGTNFVTNLDPNYMMNGSTPCTANCFTRDMNGISYYPNGIPGSVLFPSSTPSGQSVVLRQDSAGNQIIQSADGTVLTDTVGRQISLPSGLANASACGSDLQLPVTSAQAWTVPGPTSLSGSGDNGTLQYIFCYTSAEVFIPNGTNELQDGSADLRMHLGELERIILPNGQKWTFEYDSSDGPNASFGDLTKITLPTGGTITYTYEFAPRLGGTGRSVASRTVDAHDGKGPQTWTYSGGYQSISGDGPFTTTVTGPSAVPGQPGDDTVHTFMSDGVPIETNVTQYQGPAASGHVLQNTATVYDPTYGSAYGGGIFTQGYFPQTVTTTTDGVVTSQKAYQYCCNFNTLEGTKTYGLVSDVKSYDYGSGGPGSLLKEESTSYVFQSNSQYANDNMLSYVATKTVTGAGIAAQTTFGYDESAYITGSPNDVPSLGTPNTANRGFVTTVTRTGMGASSISTHSRFYSTGEIYQQIDGRNITAATYSYSPTYGYALPTQITNALGQSNTLMYDPNTGQKTSSTDANSQTTTWSYDSTGRASGISYADGGWISYCYNDAPNTCSSGTGAVNSVLVTKAENPSQKLQQEVDVDAVGRKIRTIVSEGGGSFLYTDTAYDVLGRVQSVTNPYRSTGDATYGITQYTYDALGRKIQQIDPDSHSVSWCYNGVASVDGQTGCYANASSKSNASWVDSTDESGNHIQHLSDGLGRLTAVMEPDPTSGTLALETDYTYDALGNLTYVNQIGTGSEVARTRSFAYDSLSRLLWSNNQETGVICYGQGDGTIDGCQRNGYDANGNLIRKTDARGVSISYGYDVLNRLVSKSYSGTNADASAIAARTPPVGYVYGDASNSSSSVNTIGRLLSEYTGTADAPITQRNVRKYDAMGRIKSEYECAAVSICGSVPYHFTYAYDLAGNLVSSTNGGVSTGIALTYQYDAANRLTTVTSTWDNDATHPATLFGPTAGLAQYSPAGLTNASFGTNSITNQTAFTQVRTYDNRLRTTSETDTSAAFTAAPTQSTGTITVIGSEPAPITSTGTPGTGSITIGADGTHTASCLGAHCFMHPIPDHGTFTITLTSPSETFTASVDYGGEDDTDLMTELSAALSDSSVAAPMVSTTSTFCGTTNLGSYNVDCGLLTLTALVNGTASNYGMSVSVVDLDDPDGVDYPYTLSGPNLTGGTDAGEVVYDTGNLSIGVGSATVGTTWQAGSNAADIASTLAGYLQGTGLVTATAAGSTITVTSIGTGTAANLGLSCGQSDTAGETASFTLACSGLMNATNAAQEGGASYSYAINSYAPNGDLLSVTDSVMGTWAYTYDHLNRLSTATASANPVTNYAPYGTAGLSWSYDSFGNFGGQTLTGSTTAVVNQASYSYPTADNRIYGASYDLSGNMNIVGGANLTYDAEGRVDSVNGSTFYVYDAEGRRVAKQNSSGTVTNLYVLDKSGQQASEVDGNRTWLHSNFSFAGQLATYDATGLHFHFSDWLGTRRMQISALGVTEEYCQSLPFGDSLQCFGPTGAAITPGAGGADSAENHFTGKERDVESGLDYFGARYFGSSLGRWISPDWSAKAEPVPYVKLENPQSLNLYSYVENNPITGMDPDGHYKATWLRGSPKNPGGEALSAASSNSDEPRDVNASLASFYFGGCLGGNDILADPSATPQPGPVSTAYVLTLWNDAGQNPKPALPLEGRQLEYDLEGAPNAANPNGTPTDTTNVIITEHLNPGMPNGTTTTSQPGNTGQFIDVLGRNGDRTHTGIWSTDRYFTVTKGGNNLGVVPILDRSSSTPHVMDHIQLNMSTGAVNLNGHLDPIDVR